MSDETEKTRFNLLFKEQLDRVCKGANLTQTALAKRLGKSRHALQGAVRLPKALSIEVLEDFCQIALEEVSDYTQQDATDILDAWYEERIIQPPYGSGIEWLITQYLPTRLEPHELSQVRAEMYRRFRPNRP